MNLSDRLAYIFDYSHQCVALPIRTLGCRDFWDYSFASFIAICLFVIFLLIKRLLKDRALIAEYQKRKQMRSAIADDEVMNQHKWKGDSEFDDLDQSDLANRMREKIRQRTKTNCNI